LRSSAVGGGFGAVGRAQQCGDGGHPQRFGGGVDRAVQAIGEPLCQRHHIPTRGGGR